MTLELTKERRGKIQAKLNHYLQRNREELELTQVEMAEKMGYSRSRYNDFEKSSDTKNPIVDAIETLQKWGSLENMSPAEFVEYLDTKSRKGNGAKSQAAPKLRQWQENILKALEKSDMGIRRRWSQAVVGTRRNHLDECLQVMTDLTNVGPRELTAIATLAAKLAESR